MNKKKKPQIIPILLVEDNIARIKWFQNHLPIGFRIVVPRSAGTALGIISKDSGHTYGGILLDHDLHMRQIVSSDHNFSGTNVVDAIIQYIDNDVPIMIHSMNPAKSPEMARKLDTARFEVTKTRWFDMTEENYLDWLDIVQESWDTNWEE